MPHANAQLDASIYWWYENDLPDPAETSGGADDVGEWLGGGNIWDEFGFSAGGGQVDAGEDTTATENIPQAADDVSDPSGAPGDTGSTDGQGGSSQQALGGFPQAIAPLNISTEDLAGSIILGKLKRGVTDEAPSDLPFLN